MTAESVAERFARKHSVGDGCWEWESALTGRGYGRFWVLRNGRPQGVMAHRMSLELATGLEIGPEVIVRHKCDNPPCVRPDHLETGSKADNSRDMVERNRSPRGERNASHKLRADEAVSVVARWRMGESQASIARVMGVHRSTIHDLVTGRTWGHVTGLEVTR